VFVALVIQHAQHMGHIAICSLSDSTVLLHFFIKGDFGK